MGAVLLRSLRGVYQKIRMCGRFEIGSCGVCVCVGVGGVFVRDGTDWHVGLFLGGLFNVLALNGTWRTLLRPASSIDF